MDLATKKSVIATENISLYKKRRKLKLQAYQFTICMTLFYMNSIGGKKVG